jgi:hypothetical protein
MLKTDPYFKPPVWRYCGLLRGNGGHHDPTTRSNEQDRSGRSRPRRGFVCKRRTEEADHVVDNATSESVLVATSESTSLGNV